MWLARISLRVGIPLLLMTVAVTANASTNEDHARYQSLERERFYFLDDGSQTSISCGIKADVLDNALEVIQEHRSSGRLLANLKETVSSFRLHYGRADGSLTFSRPSLTLSIPAGVKLDDETTQQLTLAYGQLQTSFRRQVEGVVSTLRGLFDELSRARLDKISNVSVELTLKGYRASFRTQFGAFNVQLQGDTKTMTMLGPRGGGMTGTSRYKPLGKAGLGLISMSSESTGSVKRGYQLDVSYERAGKIWVPHTVTVKPLGTPPNGQGFPGMSLSLVDCAVRNVR